MAPVRIDAHTNMALARKDARTNMAPVRKDARAHKHGPCTQECTHKSSYNQLAASPLSDHDL